MSKVEDRLWSELVRCHPDALELARTPQTPRQEQRRVRRAPFAIGGLGVAGAITAATLALTASTGSPAFAVTENADGSVTLTINELAGVSAANERLAKLGIRATVAREEPGCTTHAGTQVVPPPGTSYPAQERAIVQPLQSSAMAAWVIHPQAIPQGDTLSLVAQVKTLKGGASAEGFGAALFRGPAPTCVPASEERQPPESLLPGEERQAKS